MKKLKALFENYSKPTPKQWRQFGDTLLVVSTAVSSYSILTQHETIGIIVAIIGVVGKLLSNFNVEKPVDGCDENECVKP